jgi:hypothetical protein
MYLRSFILAALVPMGAFAQTITADAPFQVIYAANLNIGESYIHITNTGANGASLNGPGLGSAGNICVNVYAFDAGEELISCCSCLVTPDQTVNLGVNRDLTFKTLTGVVPTSVTVKLLATLAGTGGTGTSCTNSAATVGATTTGVAGLAAWGTTLHDPTSAAIMAAPTYTVLFDPITATPAVTSAAIIAAPTYTATETAFDPATLSAGEAASIGGRCAGIVGNGTLFGQCDSCVARTVAGVKPLAQ